MDEQKKLEKELLKKKISELKKIAAGMDPPVVPKFNWTKKMYTKALLDAEYKSKVPGAQIKDKKVTASRPGQQQQPLNPAFEKTVAEPEPDKDNRGGVREGAGRPKGMTDEKAKVRNLPQVPSTPIKQGLQGLFDMWSVAAKIEELALTDTEAEMWSLPLTQLAEYYYPNVLPEIAGTWIMAIFATVRIMRPRIKLVDEVRKQRREQTVSGASAGTVTLSGGDGKLLHYKYNDGHGNIKPIHAIPAGEPSVFTEDLDKVTCPTCIKIIDKARP